MIDEKSELQIFYVVPDHSRFVTINVDYFIFNVVSSLLDIFSKPMVYDSFKNSISFILTGSESDDENCVDADESGLSFEDGISDPSTNACNTFSCGDWVAAAIDYSRIRQFRICYGIIVSIEGNEAFVKFAAMNRYQLLTWLNEDDTASVEMNRLFRISEPTQITFSSRRAGGLQMLESDIERANIHFASRVF